ncbi:aminotransferase class I/II-fold pyridoxal phosphate-dependent enzyme [Geminocystis sp. GBBB08]|uniref:aminotransferase class I/II-fold pyridoxal phosphate-dependent enzyme n=1 Tax=Geminocystis sp. GBBB08 TaxID=2604140 RepID=UPI0027E2AE25|nr:aminotransferase class I/II-fold pyridoxal phosphate-dependent enzyme [Geminocystis sp. GBBB08]MBL1209514.1 aminotransferase class I/II-fold pyridoxal phosphate-dependent enzyme [Geminocystis sp. GBBB08]
MNNSQEKTPLLTKLQELALKQDAPFYTPGHKKGKGISQSLKKLMGEKVFCADLPELPELDNLFAPEGVIKEAQTLAAAAFGAKQTWFLVNGSTSGIIASILATCGEGDKIILPRNVHQSTIFGLILAGAIPIFINPQYNSDFDLCYTLSPSQIAHALETHSHIKAVMVVSPTYHGICANLTEIAYLTNHFSIPLLIDEAHGGHFSFHPQLPISALQAGADIAIQSTHKTLGAMTQASMLHLQGNLVNPHRINQALQLVQSSSPNYLLLASLDGARQQMAIQGKKLLTNTLNLAITAKKYISQLNYLPLLELVKPLDTFADLDITRLTINVSKLGITGYEADEILHQQFGVTCELPSLKNLTFIISIGNKFQDIEKLIKSLQALKKYQKQSQDNNNFTLSSLPNSSLKITPREAFWAEKKVVSKDLAINHISGENICPYPPGIPLIMAGEIITKEALEYAQKVINSGGIITGVSDESLDTLTIN